MFNTRLFSLIRKEFIQISRDPRTLVIALLIPVMQLFMLGYAATNDVRNLPMAVFDQDRSAAAREFLNAFRASDYFLLTFDVDFGEMVFSRGIEPPVAILYFRLHPIIIEELLALALSSIKEIRPGYFTVISREGTRLRKL